MNRCLLSTVTATTALLATVMPASAQPPASVPLTRTVSASVLGGVSAGDNTSGPALGGTIAFDVTPRVGFEGRSLFVHRDMGSSGFELSGTMLFTLASGRRAASYAAVGGGLYRAHFAMDEMGMFRDIGARFGHGTMMEPVQGGYGFMMGGARGTPVQTTQMAAFYANRMGTMRVPDGRWGMRSFTDPALAVGGGIRVDVTERVFVRPDVRALVVFGGGDTATLTTMSIGFGVKF